MSELRKGSFTIDGLIYFEGYYNPDSPLWNGFHQPVFTMESALEIKAWIELFTEDCIFIKDDIVTIYESQFFDWVTLLPENHNTEDGSKQLYGIGAGWWVWCLAESGDSIVIELNETLKLGRKACKTGAPLEYQRGELVEIIPADNLPLESGIIAWVVSDGWESDSYGFPVYSDFDFDIANFRMR